MPASSRLSSVSVSLLLLLLGVWGPTVAAFSFVSTLSCKRVATAMKINEADRSSTHVFTTTPLSRGDLLKQQLGAITFGIALTTTGSNRVGAVPPSEAPDLKSLVLTKEGKTYKFGDVMGKKGTIVVNVASQCALTGGNYPGLQDLYEKYHDKGLELLAFPSNQFGYQEPDPVEKVRKDMKDRFGVTFPIYDKIDVNGAGAHPLYQAIKKYEPELSGYSPKISWNFEKFLINENGTPVRRYRPGVDPEEMEGDIQSLLSKGVLPPARKRSLNDY